MSAETHLEVYRPFQGKLREHPLRFWPMWTTGLRTALKQRKALLILYLPAFVVTVILCFVVWAKFKFEGLVQGQTEGMSFQEQLAKGIAIAQAEQMLGVVNLILQFAKGMGVFALLAVSWFASPLFCEDRKAGAHQLYFARPITRLDYFLGKFLIASCFGLAAMLVPLLSVCIAATFCSPDWSFLKREWDVFFRVIAFSLLWTVVISSTVLLASSLAPRRTFALLGVFAFAVLSALVAGQLGGHVDPDFFALNLLVNLDTIGQDIFDKLPSQPGIDPTTAWLAVGALVAVSWTVIALRLRRLEVVA